VDGEPSRDQPRPLSGDARARVWELATPVGPWVVKLAEGARVAHEVDVLTRLAGSGLGPELVAAGEGILITARIEGAPRAPASWSADDAAAVGRLLAMVHGRSAPVGSAPGDPDDRDQLVAAIRGQCRPALRVLADAAIGTLPPPALGPAAMLHGDPWSGNVVWSPSGPVLVDWEYARGGEPAEDLAYLAALDELPDATLAAVLGGYGADAGLAARVAAWRPLMAVWCGAWLCERGAHDRGARLVALAERLMVRCEGG